MKLDGSKIVIESRYEIEDLIDMLSLCLHSYPEMIRGNLEEYKQLKDKLDVLYMTW